MNCTKSYIIPARIKIDQRSRTYVNESQNRFPTYIYTYINARNGTESVRLQPSSYAAHQKSTRSIHLPIRFLTLSAIHLLLLPTRGDLSEIQFLLSLAQRQESKYPSRDGLGAHTCHGVAAATAARKKRRRALQGWLALTRYISTYVYAYIYTYIYIYIRARAYMRTQPRSAPKCLSRKRRAE